MNLVLARRRLRRSACAWLAALALAAPHLAFADAAQGAISGEVVSKPQKLRAGVLVHVEKASGPFRPPAQPVVMDQKGMKFVPRLLPILRGTTVNFLNSDSVRHNVFTPDGDKYNLGSWPTGEAKPLIFPKSGVYRQLCNVHPEMEAFIVVLDNPFFAVTDDAGHFRIEGVPPGTYTLTTWSDKLAPGSVQVTVVAGQPVTTKLELAKP